MYCLNDKQNKKNQLTKNKMWGYLFCTPGHCICDICLFERAVSSTWIINKYIDLQANLSSFSNIVLCPVYVKCWRDLAQNNP